MNPLHGSTPTLKHCYQKGTLSSEPYVRRKEDDDQFSVIFNMNRTPLVRVEFPMPNINEYISHMARQMTNTAASLPLTLGMATSHLHFQLLNSAHE